jgi:hypothetical protein
MRHCIALSGINAAEHDDGMQNEIIHHGTCSLQAPGLRAGRVCRDEGAGRFCMRGAAALRNYEVGIGTACDNWLPYLSQKCGLHYD